MERLKGEPMTEDEMENLKRRIAGSSNINLGGITENLKTAVELGIVDHEDVIAIVKGEIGRVADGLPGEKTT